LPLREEYLKKSYSNPNNDPRGIWRGVSIKLSVGHQGGGYYYGMTTPSGKIYNENWTLPESTYLDLLDDDRIFFGKDNNSTPQKKIFASESRGQIADNLLLEHGTNKAGKNRIIKLLGKAYFDTVKPTKLIEHFIDLSKSDNDDDIILDFFAGSGTTAESLLNINLRDNSNKKFILVQLPESTSKKSEAFKDGYYNISEISKDRIRKLYIEKRNENPLLSNLDMGFKVFKLDSSNIKSWDGNPENLETSLFDAVGNIKTDRTEEDVLYEILLKYGLDLTLPIEEKTIEGKKVFNVGLGSLFICLADDITAKVAEGIGQWKEACSPEICRVIFKDNGFTDVEKTNSVQTLKRYGINEIRSI